MTWTWKFVWLVVVLGSLALLILAKVCPVFFDDNLAAWVQAVGSAAAVLWGVWLFQVEAGERKAAATDRPLVVIRAALKSVRYAADQIREVAKKDHVDPLWFERLQWAGDLLAQVPILEADNDRVIDAVVATRSRLKQAERQARLVNRTKAGTKPRRDAEGRLAILRDKVDASIVELRTMISK